MPRFKNVNGKKIQFTEIEEAQRDAEEQVWNDGAFTRAMEYLRSKRNNLLIETDYLALSDVSMSEEMTTYRQALRDLTNGLDTVKKVKTKMELNVNEDDEPILDSYKNFPTKPSE
jgi:TPP-dependent pyruvate/acetoin dehydrogenase alpha subunit